MDKTVLTILARLGDAARCLELAYFQIMAVMQVMRLRNRVIYMQLVYLKDIISIVGSRDLGSVTGKITHNA